MAKVFELRRERARIASEAAQIVQLAASEGRDNSAEEWELIKGNEARIESLDRQIAVLERVEKFEAEGRPAGRQTDPARNPGAGNGDGPELDGKHKYSLLRAFRCALGIERNGLEVEVSQEIASRTGKPAQGIYIPWNLATHRDGYHASAERRSLSTSAGAGSIANILGTDLIELLRNKMVMQQMGATVLNDMTGGTFSLPKQTAAGSAYYVAESGSPTASNPTIGQVTWTPRTLGAYYDLTRKFILQTSQDAEAFARNDLTRIMAIEYDRVAINGSGSGSQPLGILQDSGVPTVSIGTNGGDPAWANIVGLETQVATANADFGRLGYLTSNQGRGKLKVTPKIGTTFPVFMWEDGDTINGYRAMATQQVPVGLTKGSNSTCTALIFGNFESVTYANWGGMDIMVDPYTGSSSGTVRLVALTDFDVQQRWEVAFAKIVDMNQS